MSIARDTGWATALSGQSFKPGGGREENRVEPTPVKPPQRSLREGDVHIGAASDGPVGVNLARLVDGRALIQGNSGAGKSMLLRRLFEQAFGRIQQLVIDPDGEFATLAECFDVAVITGAEVNRVGGAQFAAQLRERRYSAIVDLSDNVAEDRLEISASLTEGLVSAPPEHWHPMLVLVDEAQTLAPHYDTGDAERDTRKRAIAALADLMGRGRKRGLAGVIATQRLAETSKAVVSKATNIIVGRTVFDRDLERAGALLGYTAGHAKALRTLADGEFIAIGPAIDGARRIRFRAGQTQSRHKGSAPRIEAPPAIGAADARALLGGLPTVASMETPGTASPEPVRAGKRGKAWTEAEDRIVIAGYRDAKPVREIRDDIEKAGFRRRVVSAISNRAHELGLNSARAAVAWSEEEDRIVIDGYAAEKRMMDVAAKLAEKGYRRSRQSIQMRAIHLGITRDRVNYWTEPEKEIAIAGLTAGKPYREILQDLRDAGYERGHTAIFKFAARHNFNRAADPWTAEEIDRLRELYAEKTPAKEIAEILGKPIASVRTRASNLGLRQRFAWTDQERQILIDAQARGDTLQHAALLIGRPYVNVAGMARTLQLDFRKGRAGCPPPKPQRSQS